VKEDTALRRSRQRYAYHTVEKSQGRVVFRFSAGSIIVPWNAEVLCCRSLCSENPLQGKKESAL
jgi:hypothetical protein